MVDVSPVPKFFPFRSIQVSSETPRGPAPLPTPFPTLRMASGLCPAPSPLPFSSTAPRTAVPAGDIPLPWHVTKGFREAG